MENATEVVTLTFEKYKLDPMGLITPNQIAAILDDHTEAHGLEGNAAEVAASHAQQALGHLNQLVDQLKLEGDVPCFTLVRERGHGAYLALLLVDPKPVLYFHIGTYPMDGKHYEYISQVTRLVPVTKNDDMLKKIVPVTNADRSELVRFFDTVGGTGTYGDMMVLTMGIWHDYPSKNNEERERMQESTFFNVSRVETPDISIDDRSGLLYLEMVVADNGQWNVAGRLKMSTGWRVGKDDNWYEYIVKIERPEGDEPRMKAYAGMAGVYSYIKEAIRVDATELSKALYQRCTPDIFHAFNDLHRVLKHRATSINEVAPMYNLKRAIKPHLAGLPGGEGMMEVFVLAGTQHVGTVRLKTAWQFTPMRPAAKSPDYIEVIKDVAFDPSTEAMLAREQQQSQRGRWGGGSGYRPFSYQPPFEQPRGMQGGPFSFGNPGFGQWSPFGGFGNPMMPFGEHSTLSAASLQSFGRVLMSVTENMPVHAVIKDVLAALSVTAEQYNQQQYGILMFQYDLKPSFGLQIRAVSQSGVIHYQQLFQC